ncbi:MAG: hypothetical protein V3U54_01890 [Thermodesulfobacteriota bacterium]
MFIIKGRREIKSETENRTVLLCEPDDSLRESLSLVLKPKYKTSSISYPEQVLTELSKFNSDLLILDIDPRGLKDLKIYNDIKRISPNTKILSLYVYGENAENVDSEVRKLSNAVLYKPLDIIHFLETVKRVNNE